MRFDTALFSYCLFLLFSQINVRLALQVTTIDPSDVTAGYIRVRKNAAVLILIAGVWLLLGMLLVCKVQRISAENVNAL